MEERDIARKLALCLSHSTPDNWESFFAVAQPIVAAGVIRSLSTWASASRDLADDLIQETFLKMCHADFRILRNFRAKDSNAFHVYLRTIAASIVLDYFRSQTALKKGSGKATASLDDMPAEFGAPDKSFDRVEQTMMLDRVTVCLSAQDTRNRRVFWLYHRQGLTPKDIAALPGLGMGASGVETTIYRLTRMVRDCMRKAGFLQPAILREGGRA